MSALFVGSPTHASIKCDKPIAGQRIMQKGRLGAKLVSVKEKLLIKYPEGAPVIQEYYDTWEKNNLMQNVKGFLDGARRNSLGNEESKNDRQAQLFTKVEKQYLEFKRISNNEPKENFLHQCFNWKREQYDKQKVSQAKEWLTMFKTNVDDCDLTDPILQQHYEPAEFDLLGFLLRSYIPHLRGNDKIVLPIKEGEELVNVEYTVEEIPLWLGLCAYGFVPTNPRKDFSNDKPFVLIPGTKNRPADAASGASLLSVFDPFGVGYTAFRNGEENLKKWLEKTKENGNKKAVACGFSQGGAIAVHCAVFLREFFSKTYTLNSPGVGFLTERAWKKIPQNESPIILDFGHHKDFISKKLGQVKIGYNFSIQLREEKEANKSAAEIHKMPFTQDHVIQGNKPVKTWCPKVQVLATAFLFPIGLCLLFLKRVVFGNYKSCYYQYLTGPFEWTILKIVQVMQKFLTSISSGIGCLR